MDRGAGSRIGPPAGLMRVAIPVWFDVTSIENDVPTEKMSGDQVEGAAVRAVDLMRWLDRDGMEEDVDVSLEGFGRVRVKLLGTDPD